MKTIEAMKSFELARKNYQPEKVACLSKECNGFEMQNSECLFIGEFTLCWEKANGYFFMIV